MGIKKPIVITKELICPMYDYNIVMDLYYTPSSAPCRAVDMTAKALNINFNKKFVNLRKGEHFTTEYLKLNPQHTVPTLVDGDLVLNESRVIMIYLCEKYNSKHQWYPDCPKIQAIINQRLYFDLGFLYNCFAEYYYPQMLNKSQGDLEKFKNMRINFRIFNTFMEGQLYAAGDQVTIADIALATTVTNFEMAGFDYRRYENVANWYERCKEILPGYAENYKSCPNFKKYLKTEANL